MNLMDSAWPKYQHDRKNTGQSPYPSTSDGTVTYIYSEPEEGACFESGPAIDNNGIVYIGDFSDLPFFAFHPDLKIKWSRTYRDGYEMTALIDSNGIIYTVCYDGYFRAFYPDNTIKYEFESGGYLLSSPNISISGDTIYFADWYNGLRAIDIDDGSLLWTLRPYGAGYYYASSPAVGNDGTIYFAASNWAQSSTYFIAANLDGTLNWDKANAGALYGSPAIGPDRTVYIQSVIDKILYAFDPDGNELWRLYTNAKNSSPAIATDGTLYLGNEVGQLLTIDPDGSIKRAPPIARDRIRTQAAIDANRVIYFGSWDNHIYAVNSDGTLKWNYPTINQGFASPAIASDGTIYIGDCGGNFYAFGPKLLPKLPCVIKRDEGIYSKSKYCYVGEGIICKKY